MDEPFSVALRVTVETGEGGRNEQTGAWRDRLTEIARRESGSRIWAANIRPQASEAGEVVAKTFADHPLVNTSGRVVDAGLHREASAGGRHAFVLAEVVLRPELAPIPPGGSFPDVTDEVLSDPYLVRAERWPHEPGSDDERNAAEELLQRILWDLPGELWHMDG